MALIKCPECGREISDKAAACIHCGCPVSAAQMTPARPLELYVDYHAVLSGAADGETPQRVYVQELGRYVMFPVSNRIQAGNSIRVDLANPAGGRVHFTATSVAWQNAPAQPSAQAQPSVQAQPAPAAPVQSDYETMKPILKRYKPNGFSQFFYSRRFFTLVFLFVGGIVTSAEGGMDMLMPALILFGFFLLLLIIGRTCYPIHHFKKYCKTYGIDDAIQRDTGHMNVAICAYNAFPRKKTIAYIRKLNPKAAALIERQLAASKKK